MESHGSLFMQNYWYEAVFFTLMRGICLYWKSAESVLVVKLHVGRSLVMSCVGARPTLLLLLSGREGLAT